MLYQYYFKKIKMFKIPYRILLAYHSPAGNSIKVWTYYQMLPHIIAVRKEIHILSLTFTVIQIRRALNVLFKRINTRGSFLIHANPSNGLKIHQNSVFIMITSWLPGILTNYKHLILSLRRHKHKKDIFSFYLKRPQLHAMENVSILAVPPSQKIVKARRRRVPSLPSISLSVSDSNIWLNETLSLGIPSIQICDTQSHLQKISYPIIANQKSITFNFLILSLFSETCNYSLIFEHLYFLSLYKHLNVQKTIKKKIKRKTLRYFYLSKSKKNDFLSLRNYYSRLKRSHKSWLYRKKRRHKRKRIKFRIRFRHKFSNKRKRISSIFRKKYSPFSQNFKKYRYFLSMNFIKSSNKIFKIKIRKTNKVIKINFKPSKKSYQKIIKNKISKINNILTKKKRKFKQKIQKIKNNIVKIEQKNQIIKNTFRNVISKNTNKEKKKLEKEIKKIEKVIHQKGHIDEMSSPSKKHWNNIRQNNLKSSREKYEKLDNREKEIIQEEEKKKKFENNVVKIEQKKQIIQKFNSNIVKIEQKKQIIQKIKNNIVKIEQKKQIIQKIKNNIVKIKQKKQQKKIKSRLKYIKRPINIIKKNPKKKIEIKYEKPKLILLKNKNIFIFNKKKFTYRIRPKYLYNAHKNVSPITPVNYLFLDLIRNKLFYVLKKMYKILKKYEALEKNLRKKWKMRRSEKNEKKEKLFLRNHFLVKDKHNFIEKKKLKRIYFFRLYFKKIYINLLGLKKVLKIKYKQKAPYITKIKIKKRDFPNRTICGFLYTPKLISYLKNY